MAWLTRDAEVLAAVEVGARRPCGDRAVVLHRPLVLSGSRAAPLDVAWCRSAADRTPATEGTLEVTRIRVLVGRLPATPKWSCPTVIVAPGGAFERWRLAVGDRLEIRGG